MTQVEMAKKAGINIATYNRKENGIRQFNESEIKKIAI